VLQILWCDLRYFFFFCDRQQHALGRCEDSMIEDYMVNSVHGGPSATVLLRKSESCSGGRWR
jgi:hypothetical protein